MAGQRAKEACARAKEACARAWKSKRGVHEGMCVKEAVAQMVVVWLAGAGHPADLSWQHACNSGQDQYKTHFHWVDKP
jgi:hypothetical protein